MGDTQKAQQLFLALRSTHYRDRAQQELAAIEGNTNAVQNQVAARSAAGAGPPGGALAAPAAAPAAPAPPPSVAAAEAKATRSMGAPNPRAPAAPKRAADHAAGFAP